MAAKHFAAVVMFLIVCQDLAIANPGDDFDLVILFESSDDSRSTNFVEEKRFLSRLVRQMFPSNNRIALYTFGKSTYSQFSLDMYSTPQDILQAIQYMWFSTGNGALAPAINFTIADAFQSTGGDRECTANSMLIVTHSAIIDSDQALTLAEQLVDKMVTTFILNMAGPSANLNFETLTNDSSRVIDIANWTVLQNMSLSVANSLKSDVGSTDCGRLTQWQPWTGCSRTCGYGFTFRTRQCQKENPSDKDCMGDFSENKPCFLTACTDPIDGNWAFWGNWGSCSKTCGTGLQQRARSCTLPAPANGGKACPGNNTQTKTCADYDCPRDSGTYKCSTETEAGITESREADVEIKAEVVIPADLQFPNWKRFHQDVL
ncbi:MLP-like protein [Mya arenaria]|uniref:MLP-like protein n=1 Tax=Mya arenaria TaxID=6604 RepID=A0ABY7GCX2_MYAAR|nr:MLP-like protein [Mya arenaria]